MSLPGTADPVLASRQLRAAVLNVESRDDHGRAYRVTGGRAPHDVLLDAQGPVCDCRDFTFNRLGTCKHIEAVLLYQQQPRGSIEDPTAERAAAGENRDGEIPPGLPPEEDGPHLELVLDDPNPVQGALSRSRILHLARSPSLSSVGVALKILASEGAQLDALERGLLNSEACRHLALLGVARPELLVDAAFTVGERAVAAPMPAPGPNGRPAPPPVEAHPPLLRSLAQLLEDPDALKPPEAIVPRLAYRGRVALVVGREKMGGKSTLLTAGAAAVTRGADFLDGRCGVGSVLWVSADQEHAAEITQRAVRFGADPALLHVLWPREPFADLMTALDQVQPLLLVVDTLANFARVEDPSSSAEWPGMLMPLLRAARDRDMAVALSHHAKKGEGGGYRDSTAIGANVDLLLELRPDTANAARRHVTVLGRWPAPNFTVDLVGDRYHLVTAGELSLDTRILVYIEGHPSCSGTAVRDYAGGRKQDIDDALQRLVARGAVQDVGTATRHAYEAPRRAAVPAGDLDEEGDRVPF